MFMLGAPWMEIREPSIAYTIDRCSPLEHSYDWPQLCAPLVASRVHQGPSPPDPRPGRTVARGPAPLAIENSATSWPSWPCPSNHCGLPPILFFFFLMIRPPPSSPLFPSPTPSR